MYLSFPFTVAKWEEGVTLSEACDQVSDPVLREVNSLQLNVMSVYSNSC